MATKKRSTTGGSGSKKSTRPKTAAEKRKANQIRDRRRQWSVVLFVVGVLLTALAFVHQGAPLWMGARGVLSGLFGFSAYFLGPLVLYWAVLLVLNTTIWDNVLRAFVLCATVCGTLAVFSSLDLSGLTLMESLDLMYTHGQQELMSGGVLGMLLGGSLLMLCGRPAANIILLVLLFLQNKKLFASLHPLIYRTMHYPFVNTSILQQAEKSRHNADYVVVRVHRILLQYKSTIILGMEIYTLAKHSKNKR